MDSSKRSSDWNKGLQDRLKVATSLNTYLQKEGIYIEWDKSEFGAIFCVQSIIKSKKIPIYIRFSNDFGFFIKVPAEYISNPLDYYEQIKSYLVLYVKRDIQVYEKYSNLMTVEHIMNNSNWKMETSKGNKNRLQFDFKIDSLVYTPPSTFTMFSPSLITQIVTAYENIHGGMVNR